ncbi:tryptophan halogenase family protein [Ideonella sp.]|jgi:tryptophan halogenase|uniref:tryptophan halogenase family protein n=1 Tax=Ideonella sp. TaxID=1929293 RepID=UPI0037BEC885
MTLPTAHAPQAAGPAAPKPIRKVVIAGGGTAGWMAAAALSKTLGKQLDICLIESDEIGTVGVGEATIPTLLTFHQLLGIPEQSFMAATQATFKLGIQFESWRQRDEDYIHSFGLTGKDHWTAGFQHFWHKGRERGLASDYGDYCLELRAAQEGKFAHLPNAGMNYAFHLDATRYARFLRSFSEGFGVQRREGKIQAVLQHPGSDHIAALRLADGTLIEGDLFIDCTGFRGLLIGETLGVPCEDWSQWLFCDRALAVQTSSVGEPVPYTRSMAHSAGWQWRIPLQHRVGNGLVWSSRFMSDEQAQQTLLSRISGEVLTPLRPISFKPCQREKTWVGNCVALCLASGFLEPLESTSIHLIQRGIVRLMQMFPSAGINPSDVAEYNAQARDEIEHIRDFIILHYKVTQRDDTPFWQACRDMSVPPSLQHRIELFQETGRVFRKGNELFAENSWIQVMLGQGIWPQQHHPSADLMGDEELQHFLQSIRQNVEGTLAQLPTHQAYVKRYCPAMAP